MQWKSRPQKRFKLRRQMAAAAGKKESTSLSLFMVVYGLEVEEELSTMATQTWAQGAGIVKWHTEQKEAWMRQMSGLARELFCVRPVIWA